MPLNKEKAMSDAINALVRLDMRQLILFNAHLADHMFNMLQHADVSRAQKEAAENRPPPN